MSPRAGERIRQGGMVAKGTKRDNGGSIGTTSPLGRRKGVRGIVT